MLSREDFYMIKQMRQQGAYIVDIATQIGCSERTVRRYLKYPEPPARKTRHKMAEMDYIDMRLAENVWNGEVILAEIKAMGYTGGRSMLLRQFRKTPEQRFTQEHSLFFRLLNRRYEKASIVLTSNKGFADWGRD
ncbi:ATP-binding protein, partial [Escherichia coli]